MKTAAQNRSANSDGSIIARGPTFSLVNALVYVEHRPGHSLGKKSDEDLQYSPRSWPDDFMQPFSWCSSLVRALDFLNKLILPGVRSYIKITFSIGSLTILM